MPVILLRPQKIQKRIEKLYFLSYTNLKWNVMYKML